MALGNLYRKNKRKSMMDPFVERTKKTWKWLKKGERVETRSQEAWEDKKKVENRDPSKPRSGWGSGGMWEGRKWEQEINQWMNFLRTGPRFRYFDRDFWSRGNVGTARQFDWKPSSRRLTYRQYHDAWGDRESGIFIFVFGMSKEHFRKFLFIYHGNGNWQRIRHPRRGVK